MYHFALRFNPLCILPLEPVKTCHNRRRLRSYLTVIAVRIRLVQLPSVTRRDKILIHAPVLCLIRKQLEYSGLSKSCHLITASVPAVKVSHNLNTLSRRCPDCKINSLFSVALRTVSTHLLINLIVRSLTEYISVGFGQKYLSTFHIYPPCLSAYDVLRSHQIHFTDEPLIKLFRKYYNKYIIFLTNCHVF